MPLTYQWRFHVRTYDMDARGVVKPTAYLNYMEEGGMQASAAVGYSYDWYQTHHHIWVARKHTIRFFTPATYPDELEMHTWISDTRRVQSHRQYDLYRVSDGARIMRARTNWVYLNTETLRPERIPAELVDAVGENQPLEDLDTGILNSVKIEAPVIYTEKRIVQNYELDAAGHVNNSVYLAWAEQSIINALRSVEWPPERVSTSDFALYPLAHEIEYFRSALDREPVTVKTQLAEIGGDRAAWLCELSHGETGELLVKDIVVRSFADAHGPRSIPDALFMALVQKVPS